MRLPKWAGNLNATGCTILARELWVTVRCYETPTHTHSLVTGVWMKFILSGFIHFLPRHYTLSALRR